MYYRSEDESINIDDMESSNTDYDNDYDYSEMNSSETMYDCTSMTTNAEYDDYYDEDLDGYRLARDRRPKRRPKQPHYHHVHHHVHHHYFHPWWMQR
ncbi:hypothetical protein ACFLKB_13650 [Clostridium sp. FAM 1755]|uniref:hypothetical protein n=1 Tax=Clostridium TaxID=1485 RepID=UPI0006ABD3F6|nr:hypothetical protein [Clostridium sp. L74]